MQKIIKILFLSVFFYNCGNLKAQDTLILINKDTISCFIEKISRSEIEYRTSLSSNKFVGIIKSEVWIIIYHNGEVDTINNINDYKETEINDSQINSDSTLKDETEIFNSDLYQKGYETGFGEFREGGKDLFEAVICASACVPIVTNVVSLVASGVDVKPNRIKTPSYYNSKNKDYRKGYLDGAKKSRNKSLFYSNIIGLGIAGALIVMSFTF